VIVIVEARITENLRDKHFFNMNKRIFDYIEAIRKDIDRLEMHVEDKVLGTAYAEAVGIEMAARNLKREINNKIALKQKQV
jgi:hypothetical protein